MSDHELLQCYARERSERAFATLVERHLPLVYSAARRQVCSPDLAADVAQSVFLDLSRQAATFPSDQSLVAWLHVVTRRTAVDLVRTEARRHAREQALASEPMSPPPSPWSEIEPLLDEAVETLGEPDRTAILLRFFQNKSLRDVGAALGTSDDAAQKRVTRALDQLRTFFFRRGIAVTAAGLATDLSAHALHTVPAALGGAITASAASLGTAALHVTTAEAAKTLAMTTLQKSLVATAVALSLGIGLYEAVAITRQTSDLDQLHVQSAALFADLTTARNQQAAAAQQLAAVESQIDTRLARARPPASGSDEAAERQIRKWFARRDHLKELATRRPDLVSPEMQLLTDDQWFAAATRPSSAADPDDETELRETFAFLRRHADNLLIPQLRLALNAYLTTTGGVLPDSLSQLLPHFDPSVAPELISRYELLYSGKVSDVPASERGGAIIVTKNVVDSKLDSFWHIGTTSFGAGGRSTRRPAAPPVPAPTP